MTGGQALQRMIDREADRRLARELARAHKVDQWGTRVCWWFIGFASSYLFFVLLRAAAHFDRWKWMVAR